MRHKKSFAFWAMIVSIVVLSSCKKDEFYKQPTDIQFVMDLDKNTNYSPHLTFDTGYIVLEDFVVSGDRVEGEDIYFETEYPTGLTIPFNLENQVPELKYDLPQGIYKSLTISFNTLDEFDTPNLVVEGDYTNLSNVVTPIRFEFKSAEYFSITAKSESNSDQIILEKDMSQFPPILLNPNYWFDIISISKLDNAGKTTIDGTPTILISSSKNEDIYDLIVDRIDENAETTFE